MKMTEIELYTEVIFEKIKHYTEEGVEFWYARELQKVLEYKEWRNFLKAVNKAKEACEMAQQSMIDHFVDVNNMVELGSGSKLRREQIQGEAQANETHYNVGRKVRQTISELGGTMPEELPVPEKSIQQIEAEQTQLKT